MLKKNMMPGHGYVLEVEDNNNNVDVLISLKPIGNVNGEPDYIAVLHSYSCGQNARRR